MEVHKQSFLLSCQILFTTFLNPQKPDERISADLTSRYTSPGGESGAGVLEEDRRLHEAKGLVSYGGNRRIFRPQGEAAHGHIHDMGD
jgi:hypothetical protein